MNRPYSAGLGIEAGDLVVSTGWETGPYEVWSVSKPRRVFDDRSSLVVLPWPVVGLTLIHPRALEIGQRLSFSYITEIRREGDRYFSGAEEVVIQKTRGEYMPLGLFDAPVDDDPPGYAFQTGVDYHCLDGELWHCPRCGRDYNALKVPTVPEMVPGDPRGRYPFCPHCGHWPQPLYVIHPGEVISTYAVQMHARMVEQYRQFAPERIAYFSKGNSK